MFEAADRDCPVDREHSYMVGDKWLDTQAGARFGLRTVLVGTGYGAGLYEELLEQKAAGSDSAVGSDSVVGLVSAEHPMDFYAENLLAAARWILDRERK